MKTASPSIIKLIINSVLLVSCALTMSLLAGCGRGRSSEDTPVHLVNNMDNQPRYEVQGQSQFFADGMTDRLPVEGTIARDHLITDIAYNSGRDADSVWLDDAPVAVTYELLEHGQERFDIFCKPCHGRLGDSKGTVSQRGMLPPPTFHSDSLRQMGDGYLYEVISIGKGNMPSYSCQIPVADRWAIVKYVRALQRSQNAGFEDVPVDTTTIVTADAVITEPTDTTLVSEESVTE